jgi:hypothetical protein
MEEVFRNLIYNDKFIYVTNKDEILRRRIKAYDMLLNTSKNLVEIEEEIRRSHGYKTPLIQTQRDIMQYYYIIHKDTLKMTLEDIKKRFADDPDDVEERMLFRIELYKEGWSIDQIESYIYKYMIKGDKPYFDEIIYKNYFHNVMSMMNIVKKEREIIKGRPSLPPVLKRYVNQKHISKVKDNMRNIYKKSELFDSIKESLFTQEEITTLIKDNKYDETLISKIKNLYIRDI